MRMSEYSKKFVMNIDSTWKKESGRNCYRYPVAADAKGFFFYGFCRRNDSSADFMGWYGLVIFVESSRDMMTSCTAEISLCEGEPVRTTVRVPLEKGRNRIEIPFADFPVETVAEDRWQFVNGIEVLFDDKSAEYVGLTGLKACRSKGIAVDVPIRGRAQETGESAEYEGTVYNCTDQEMAVELQQVFEGWESMTAELFFEGTGQPEQTAVIQAYGAVGFHVCLRVPERMVAGGHENTRIRAAGRNRYGTFEQQVELKTMRTLPHPYIYHDKKGWQEVMEKIRKYPVYEKPYREYLDTADRWEVKPTAEGRIYCYETWEENNIMSAAYAYALTGKEEYAEKMIAFFRCFTDEEAGYPARLRGCSQSYVQEGHFFQHLAIPFDILYDFPLFTQEDKNAVEKTFRIYMGLLDKHIRSGKISNWLISEVMGALYCALAIQDMDLVLRFLYGNGGLVEQFRHGIFNDGWWHECSVGYNTWVSSMMIHAAHAMRPFGYNLADAYFQIPFNEEVSASYGEKHPMILSGMYNRKWGGNRKNYVCIRDMFDAVLPFLDYRGVLFGIADSDEKKLSGVHFGSTYDLAYSYYQNREYIPVMLRSRPDPIFGHPMLQDRTEEEEEQAYVRSAWADNVGIVMLRSRRKGGSPREQIQAVLRYGSHGGAHGHFDSTGLLSVMRYGRSFYNPENCWWGYAHFMYKFYVQCSLTKNMVVVDDKMQIPADSRRIPVSVAGNGGSAGQELQAAGVEVRTQWAYPPYGGMVYYQDAQTNTREDLQKRCSMNYCFLPIVTGEDSPVYGEMSAYTEEILQRRVMAVADDYLVLFDYAQGEAEHTYDSLMQIKGFKGIAGDSVRYTGHTEQFDANPLSDAQFITDCSWYSAKGVTKAEFETVFTEEDAGEQQRCDRSNYNEPGILKMDVHTAWPPVTEQIVGRVAIYDGWAADGTGYTIPLEYRIEGDRRVLAEGTFDGWILGRGEADVELTGIRALTLSLKQSDISSENRDFVRTPQGCFWGEAVICFPDGTSMDIGSRIRDSTAECNGQPDAGWDRNITFENIDRGFGIGRDYKNGRVTIVGAVYENAIPASTLDHEREGKIRICLDHIPPEKLKGARLHACVGVDAFAGDEFQKRKMYAVRTRGKKTRYITVVEPYERDPVIREVVPIDENCVKILLKDGRQQTLSIKNMENDPNGGVQIFMEETVSD